MTIRARVRGRLSFFTLALAMMAWPSAAQERVTLLTDVDFYVDNTEFFNDFRQGETLFGAAFSFAAEVEMNERVSFRGGIVGNHRFGSDRVEQWRPIFRVAFHGDHQRFVIGTLDTVEREDGPGPDRTGPHGLLPPLQRETLSFTRPHEGGLQWKIDAARLRQDVWVNWQQINTDEHRERFDAGLAGRLSFDVGVPISVAYQFHIVHEGGQLFDTGPVRDSWAIGPGVIVEPRFWFFDRTAVEGYALFSRNVPDRADLEISENGHGVFTRFSGEKNGWRGHLIIWGASDWIKDEGDENYGSLRRNGSPFAATRHYGELGLSRTFHPADGVEVEGSGRAHRVDLDYSYSFRILTRVDFDFPIWSQ
jgi:hypothetical protein